MTPELARKIFVLIAEAEFDLWERRAQEERERQSRERQACLPTPAVVPAQHRTRE